MQAEFSNTTTCMGSGCVTTALIVGVKSLKSNIKSTAMGCACSTKANDLKEQLRWWLHPPEPTWQSREQRLDWLQGTLEQARDIARNLQAQGALLGDARHIATYIYIVKVRQLAAPPDLLLHAWLF